MSDWDFPDIRRDEALTPPRCLRVTLCAEGAADTSEAGGAVAETLEAAEAPIVRVPIAGRRPLGPLPGRPRRKRWRPPKDGAAFQAGLDPRFAAEIADAVAGGERLFTCIQCGTCSGACPLVGYMDHPPRRIIALVRAGAREEVLASFTPWVCASCYACTVACPREIPITEIMHALRRRALREGSYPRRFTNPVIMRELMAMAMARGRSTESLIALKAYLRTDPWQLGRHAATGLRLLRRGRMGFRPASMRDPSRVRRLLEAVGR
jgi:heterodisulfide reductase subunit C